MKPGTQDSLLGRLARRAVTADAAIRPRLPSRFETMQAPSTERTESWGEVMHTPSLSVQAQAGLDPVAPPSRHIPSFHINEAPLVPPAWSRGLMPPPGPQMSDGLPLVDAATRAPTINHLAPLGPPVTQLHAPLDVPQVLPAPHLGTPSSLAMPAHEAHTADPAPQTTAMPVVRLQHQALVPLISTEPRPPMSVPPSPGEPVPHRAHASWPATPEGAPAAHTTPTTTAPIEITIGRIEIRGLDQDVRTPVRAVAPPRSPSMPLADYLRQRDERRS